VATFKAYANGATMGVGNPQPVGGKRGAVEGWSAASVRRHKRWLYGVEAPLLTGAGDAVTLTMRDTPATVEDWQRLLQGLFRGLRDAGMTRWHWVVEWQRRGTPHVHLAVYGPEDQLLGPGPEVIALWLRLSHGYGSRPAAQVFTPITGPVGWLKYLSKHASRGVAHYQRQGKPAGWSKTGRLWGYGGSWPIATVLEGALTTQEFWRVRRMVRAWAIADARKRKDWRGVSYLRRMLACDDRGLSSVRGVSEWVPGPLFVNMAVCAGWTGELTDTADWGDDESPSTGAERLEA